MASGPPIPKTTLSWFSSYCSKAGVGRRETEEHTITLLENVSRQQQVVEIDGNINPGTTWRYSEGSPAEGRPARLFLKIEAAATHMLYYAFEEVKKHNTVCYLCQHSYADEKQDNYTIDSYITYYLTHSFKTQRYHIELTHCAEVASKPDLYEDNVSSSS